jgi:glutamyl-tRNA synthetase
MPHILSQAGNKKLSKRDGAKDVLDYVREGYLPPALVSFIATLGWNDGSQQEIFTVDELIERFSLQRVGRSGAQFDERRLQWVNGVFIRSMNIDELLQLVHNYWPASAKEASDDYKRAVLGLTQERLKYFEELPKLTNFFFEDLPVDMSLIDGNKRLKKCSRQELRDLLTQAQASLKDSNFSIDDLTKRLNALLETTGQKPGVLFSLIRVATTWAPASPGLADTLHVLGKEKSLARLKESLKQFN